MMMIMIIIITIIIMIIKIIIVIMIIIIMIIKITIINDINDNKFECLMKHNKTLHHTGTFRKGGRLFVCTLSFTCH